MSQDRMTILQQLEDGKIDAQEALRLLESESQPSASAAAVTKTLTPDPVIQKWKRWWLILFGSGVGITVLGAWFMYLSGVSLWLFITCIPFAIGVIVMALAWWSRTARWLHVRVDTGKDEFPRHIAISFPIPSRLIAWGVRFASKRNLNASEKLRTVSEMIAMMDEGVSSEAPLLVEVNEGKEHVQVFIG